MKVSFVIPSINAFEMLFNDCIDSFNKFNGDNNDHLSEIIVIDDGSNLELRNRIKDECHKRKIVFDFNEKNSGFSTTVNKGIRLATGDIIVLVNNDVIFTKNVITPIVESFEKDSKVGIVGALLFYPEPYGKIQHGGMALVGEKGFTHRGWHKTIEECPELKHPSFLIGVTGALYAMKREMLDQIGLFNEDYFLACDDTEVCLRAWKNNWKVLYNPDVEAIHAEGGTRGRTDLEKTQKHRFWFIKEHETNNKFYNRDFYKYNMQETLEKVSLANADLHRRDKAVEVKADRVEFGNSYARPKILVRRTGAMGDLIMATPVIRQLKLIYPEHDIVVATACPDVLRGNPNVSAVTRYSESALNYDYFFDLDLVYEKNPKTPVWQAYAMSAIGNCEFSHKLDLFSNDQDCLKLKSRLPQINWLVDRVVVLHMGVSWPSRTWPRHYWTEVCRRLSASGFKVITIGEGADYKSDLYANVINMVGSGMSIFELRELCKLSKLFVGIDSGPFHVAQTTDVPIVGIFTVANPKFRVVPRSSRTIALVPKVECRFCLHDMPAPVTDVSCRFGTNHCLMDITIDDVVNSALECVRT